MTLLWNLLLAVTIWKLIREASLKHKMYDESFELKSPVAVDYIPMIQTELNSNKLTYLQILTALLNFASWPRFGLPSCN